MRRRGAVVALVTILWMGLSPAGCSKDVTSIRPDRTPPQAVADLRSVSVDCCSITLEWTAVGDDGGEGRAAAYDLRYSSAPIDAANWGSATQVDREPVPRAAGATESLTLSMPGYQEWYFAMRVADDVPNWSGLSNVGLSPAPPPDTIPPGAITDLAVVASDEGSITLRWTSVADDSAGSGVQGIYVLDSTSPIDEGTWSGARWWDWHDPSAPGTPDSLTVRWLDPQTTYYFSVRALDGRGNRGGLSNPAIGTTEPAIPPAAVTDLSIVTTTERSITVRWTAAGDDGMTGAAEDIEIRASGSPIDDANWDGASVVDRLGNPPQAGAPLTTELFWLPPDSTYYIALKTRDDVDAWSGLSNVVSGRTEDTTPPPSVTDLRVVVPESPTDLVVIWTAVGDDDRYESVHGVDLRYSTEPITDATWADARVIADNQSPRYPGLTESYTVEDLDIGRYYFAIKVVDEAGNWSALSNVAAGVVPFRLEAESYLDSGDLSGLPISRTVCGRASGTMAVDGVDGDGDWIRIPFETLVPVCFTDSLRSGGDAGSRRIFTIDFLRSGDGTVVAGDTVRTIPGIGIGCTSTNFDCIWSARVVCLEPGSYFARIRRIGGDARASRIDFLDLRESAD